MKAKRNTPVLLALIVIASFLLAACGDAPVADATMSCTGTSCTVTVSNNTEETMKYYVSVGYVAEGAEVSKEKTNVNPQKLPWVNVFYNESNAGHFVLEPGKTHKFEWTTHRSGLYKMRISSFDKNENTVFTEVYAYFSATTTPTADNNSFSLTCDDASIIAHVETATYDGKRTALYVNDAIFIFFVDNPNGVSEIAIPKPVFTIASPYVDVRTQKYDNYLELNREGHADPTNADFCAISYAK